VTQAAGAGGALERVGEHAGAGDAERFRVRGAVTMANVEALLAEGRRLFQSKQLTVDLAQVGEVDSSSVSLLLQWLRDAESKGQRLSYVNLDANIRSLAVLYGVTELLPIE
jgi:phospholipid transport system transporter-binding protein